MSVIGMILLVFAITNGSASPVNDVQQLQTNNGNSNNNNNIIVQNIRSFLQSNIRRISPNPANIFSNHNAGPNHSIASENQILRFKNSKNTIKTTTNQDRVRNQSQMIQNIESFPLGINPITKLTLDQKINNSVAAVTKILQSSTPIVVMNKNNPVDKGIKRISSQNFNPNTAYLFHAQSAENEYVASESQKLVSTMKFPKKSDSGDDSKEDQIKIVDENLESFMKTFRLDVDNSEEENDLQKIHNVADTFVHSEKVRDLLFDIYSDIRHLNSSIQNGDLNGDNLNPEQEEEFRHIYTNVQKLINSTSDKKTTINSRQSRTFLSALSLLAGMKVRYMMDYINSIGFIPNREVSASNSLDFLGKAFQLALTVSYGGPAKQDACCTLPCVDPCCDPNCCGGPACCEPVCGSVCVGAFCPGPPCGAIPCPGQCNTTTCTNFVQQASAIPLQNLMDMSNPTGQSSNTVLGDQLSIKNTTKPVIRFSTKKTKTTTVKKQVTEEDDGEDDEYDEIEGEDPLLPNLVTSDSNGNVNNHFWLRPQQPSYSLSEISQFVRPVFTTEPNVKVVKKKKPVRKVITKQPSKGNVKKKNFNRRPISEIQVKDETDEDDKWVQVNQIGNRKFRNPADKLKRSKTKKVSKIKTNEYIKRDKLTKMPSERVTKRPVSVYEYDVVTKRSKYKTTTALPRIVKTSSKRPTKTDGHKRPVNTLSTESTKRKRKPVPVDKVKKTYRRKVTTPMPSTSPTRAVTKLKIRRRKVTSTTTTAKPMQTINLSRKTNNDNEKQGKPTYIRKEYSLLENSGVQRLKIPNRGALYSGNNDHQYYFVSISAPEMGQTDVTKKQEKSIPMDGNKKLKKQNKSDDYDGVDTIESSEEEELDSSVQDDSESDEILRKNEDKVEDDDDVDDVDNEYENDEYDGEVEDDDYENDREHRKVTNGKEDECDDECDDEKNVDSQSEQEEIESGEEAYEYDDNDDVVISGTRIMRKEHGDEENKGEGDEEEDEESDDNDNNGNDEEEDEGSDGDEEYRFGDVDEDYKNDAGEEYESDMEENDNDGDVEEEEVEDDAEEDDGESEYRSQSRGMRKMNYDNFNISSDSNATVAPQIDTNSTTATPPVTCRHSDVDLTNRRTRDISLFCDETVDTEVQLPVMRVTRDLPIQQGNPSELPGINNTVT